MEMRQTWGLLLALTASGLTSFTPCSAEEPAAAGRVRLAERTRAFAEQFGIQVAIPDEPGMVGIVRIGGTTYSPAATEDCAAFLVILEQELGRYPVEFLKATKLRRVVLCKEVAHAGYYNGGYTDWPNLSIYCDVRPRATDDPTNSRFRLLINHELYHLMDIEIYYDKKYHFYRDKEWAALNDRSFNYYLPLGSPHPVNRGLDASVPGFLTGYSRANVNEDKAELFSWMIVRPDIVEQRMKDDQILTTKVRRLKSVSSDFCPSMNDKFWERISVGR